MSSFVPARVAAILIRAASPDILLVRKHSDTRWMLPGGHAKIGESPSLAATRVLQRKLGITLQPRTRPDVIVCDDQERPPRNPGNMTFLYRWGSIPAGTEFIDVSESIGECAWVDRNKILSSFRRHVRSEDAEILAEWDNAWGADDNFWGPLYLERRNGVMHS